VTNGPSPGAAVYRPFTGCEPSGVGEP
jgi:hypothetical protein